MRWKIASDQGQRNLDWARVTSEALHRLGVKQVCISPGSRNTPLTVAFSEHSSFDRYSHVDERSAGFFALGMSKSAGTPAVLVCTSGTAAANYLPAVVEASLSCVPLLVITADRPAHVVGTGANQTIDQQNLYGVQVRWFRDVGLPVDTPGNLLQHLWRAVQMSLGLNSAGEMINPPGPVHLNFPFDEPLLPAQIQSNDLQPFSMDLPQLCTPCGSAAPSVSANFKPVEVGSQPLIIAGGMPAGSGVEIILDLAEALGAPIFTDPASQLRYHRKHPNIITGYDLFLRSVELQPDQVLRFGKKPTSKILCSYLDRWSMLTTLISPWGRYNDDCPGVIQMHTSDFCLLQVNAMGRRTVQNEWLKKVQKIDMAVNVLTEEALQQEPLFEGAVVAAGLQHLGAEDTLFIGNSMPVRDLDMYSGNRDGAVRVQANRGASGIDGVVSTALGAAVADDRQHLLVLGDLSFCHDMNGLLAGLRYGIQLTIVVINNNGGGIFSFLPVRDQQLKQFDEFWTTPHGLDLERVAALYRCHYRQAVTHSELQAALSESAQLGGICLIDVPSDIQQNLLQHRAIEKSVAKRLRQL